MIKAVKCPACRLYYNGQTYSRCPHCNTENQNVIVDNERQESITKVPAICSVEAVTEVESIKNATTVEEQSPTMSIWDKPKAERKRTMPLFRQAKEGAGEISEEPDKNEPEGLAEPKPEVTEDKPVIPKMTAPAVSNTINLRDQLKKSGRTVGKFTSSNNDDAAEPVVGWLVCVKGAYFGQSFALKSGKNKIGRSAEMDIKLLNDESVSRTCVASIVFDARAGEFSAIPGESDSLCYISAEAIYERKVLAGFEEIELGDSEKNKFIFVPLCGEEFNWASYQK